MKIYKKLIDFKKVKDKNVIALGVFDGVHIGHRKIIIEAVRLSKMLGAKSLIVTFEPHPKNIGTKKPPQFINTLSQRLDIIKELGVDRCLIVRFTKKFASITADYFVKKVLLDKLKMSGMVVSSDYRFGSGARGDLEFLRDVSIKWGFRLKEVPILKIDKKIIKSTLIRNLLSRGKLKEAERMLARPYFIEGLVARGSGLGLKIGFPTANLRCNQDIILPTGVYAAKVKILKRSFDSVVNIGFRPTVAKKRIVKKIVEAHLLEFNRKIYGEKIKVYFLKYLRSERKFKDLSNLKAAIKKDAGKAVKHFLDKDKK